MGSDHYLVTLKVKSGLQMVTELYPKKYNRTGQHFTIMISNKTRQGNSQTGLLIWTVKEET